MEGFARFAVARGTHLVATRTACSVRKTTVKYWAAYFPSYWNPNDGVEDEEQYSNRLADAQVGGNQTAFWSLNAYLDKFVGFHQLLKSRSMDEEDFQTLIAKHLGRIEE